jgi:hypothetical protein
MSHSNWELNTGSECNLESSRTSSLLLRVVNNKEAVKTQLKKISSLVQLLSIETLEEILKSMSIFSYKNLKVEFAQMSMMHAQK